MCLKGTVPQRKELARVAAQLVSKPEHFNGCKSIIEHLKDDPEPEVRRLLLAMFDTLDLLQYPKGVTFVQSFVDSETFRDDPATLIYRLKEYSGSLLPFADVLFGMCDQFNGPLADESRDMTHDLSPFLSTLMRLYEQAEEEQETPIVNRCLDAIDAMFEQRVGVVQELAQAMG